MDLGVKIKRLRLQCGLTQEELADRCELTKGYISQLENNLTSPSITTLMDILAVLGSDLKSFFNEEVDEQIVFTENDFFEKQDEGELITWLVQFFEKRDGADTADSSTVYKHDRGYAARRRGIRIRTSRQCGAAPGQEII